MIAMRAIAIVPLLFSVAACWSPRYFAPREHVDAQGPDGYPAALYPIVPTDPATASTAEARVWSHGSQARFTDDDREVVELHIGFELENNSKEPLRLDLGPLACEDLMIDGVLHVPLSPIRLEGDGVAAPGTTARVDAVFEPPAAVPRDVDSFAVRFVVRAGEREVLHQVTPFGPYVRPVPEDRHWGGFGFGFGMGFHSSHLFCR